MKVISTNSYACGSDKSNKVIDNECQAKHEIYLLNKLVDDQNKMLEEYEKDIEELSRASPNTSESASSFDSESYIELEKNNNYLKSENNKLKCRLMELGTSDHEGSTYSDEAIKRKEDKIFEELNIEIKYLKQQVDTFRVLLHSREVEMEELDSEIERLENENKQFSGIATKSAASLVQLKAEYEESQKEFTEKLVELNSLKEDQNTHYRERVKRLKVDKELMRKENKRLNSIICELKANKCTIDCIKNTNSAGQHILFDSTLDDISKLVFNLEEQFNRLESSNSTKSDIVLEKSEEVADEIIAFKEVSPLEINLKSLQDEIEEIKATTIESSPIGINVFETFTYLTILILIYELIKSILAIFNNML